MTLFALVLVLVVLVSFAHCVHQARQWLASDPLWRDWRWGR